VSASTQSQVPEVELETLTTAIRDLSNGNVVAIPPSGPILRGEAGPRRTLNPGTFLPALGTRDRILVALLSTGWLTCVVAFWIWWLQPEHRVSWLGVVVNSALLLCLLIQPAYFAFSANRLRHLAPDLPVPSLRVAFVVTRAPSEAWAVAQATLEAMLAQDFPHRYDVWLCDEQPSSGILAWCGEHGVLVSCRYGVEEYHRAQWPRRTRCKEGNLAYFYDQVGYEDYDVVSQLDCDHIPTPTYLAEIVRPFTDPAIGYTAAPSVCDTNADNSWSARGRLHREAPIHGPLQLAHNGGLAPICVGSHYAVRTQALREIGGVGPELLEDFSTSFLLNSAGWQGAYAIAAEAHGNGPLSFSAMLVQEFQWSRSMTTVLLRLVPRHLSRITWRLRLRFLYALSFYVLIAMTTMCGLLLPPIAASTGIPWVSVNYAEFLARWWSILIWLILLTALLRRRGLLRPVRAPIVSWENWLYCLTRWPLMAWGVCAAALQQLRPRQITFKVTPKTVDGVERLSAGLILPYLVISLVAAGAAVVGEFRTHTAGYVFLCLLVSLTYAAVAVSVCLLHGWEATKTTDGGRAGVIVRTAGRPLLLASLAIPLLATGISLFPGFVTQAAGW
jgi:cellulose synthase/poly-beta-1,6-N-acetylglucosamine synthase-like glycosyltransferase